MTQRIKIRTIVVIAVLLFATLVSHTQLLAGPGPNDGRVFHGRIAYSADGNHNDPDDWASSPVALAIIAQAGLKDRLVHFDYNCIMTGTNPEWERIHTESVLGAVKQYAYDRSLFHDCQQNVAATIDSIANAINDSSEENPLYFVIAGPVEVPYLGIQESDPEKRKFVYCISHSQWNDGYATDYSFAHTKRSVIPQGIKWVQIPDQNPTLAFSKYGTPAKPEQFKPFFWMRDSNNPQLKFLWKRMVVSTRPDCSDAGMAWFLVTGDSVCQVTELRELLEEGIVPAPTDPRPSVRLEAENFLQFERFETEYRNDRKASHRLNVKRANAGIASIRTLFLEPYTATSGRYDVDVRFFDEERKTTWMELKINGVRQGEKWKSPGDGKGWTTATIEDVSIREGDEIAVTVDAADDSLGRFDYVQINHRRTETPSNTEASATLDDPDALPGQIIVAGKKPGYLKYNGGGPAFLCGPDNPEDFLFRGELNADGTRSGGEQDQMIERLAKAGVNAIHFQMFRMQHCNFKDEGDDTHCPFVDHDPSKPLDDDILNQWDKWLGALEEHRIMVHLEFYNDATDVELMGWKLDASGNLPADEARFVAGIVKRFKPHKNILWGIQESCNKLPHARTPHFKKIAALIAKVDNHNHPIVQSFVVPNDPEGDFPVDGLTSDEYIGDPHVRVVTWLHVVPHGADLEKQHAEYLSYWKRDSAKFVVMKNETYHHPKRGSRSRKYMWSCAMTGMHCLEAYHHADDSPNDILREDGYINHFMERTAFHAMTPRDELAVGSTKWVLANSGTSYIAYTYDYQGPMGVKGLAAGDHQLLWLDTVDGDEVTQRVRVEAGDASWKKPDSIGSEVALSITRVKSS